MGGLLGSELERFVESFAEPRSRALRVNPQKTDVDELRPFGGADNWARSQLAPVPREDSRIRRELGRPTPAANARDASS